MRTHRRQNEERWRQRKRKIMSTNDDVLFSNDIILTHVSHCMQTNHSAEWNLKHAKVWMQSTSHVCISSNHCDQNDRDTASTGTRSHRIKEGCQWFKCVPSSHHHHHQGKDLHSKVTVLSALTLSPTLNDTLSLSLLMIMIIIINKIVIAFAYAFTHCRWVRN